MIAVAGSSTGHLLVHNILWRWAALLLGAAMLCRFVDFDDGAALDAIAAALHHSRQAAASPPRAFTLDVVTFALTHVISEVTGLRLRIL